MKHLNVLIACEESQQECIAFRNAGHNAFSCDVQPCRRGGHPEWHIRGDVTPYLDGVTQFYTQDGKHHHLSRWHLMICHPPCTYLCKVGSVHLHKNEDYEVLVDGVMIPVNHDRYMKMLAAKEFFYKCLAAKAPLVAVENPIPMKLAGLPKPDCFVQPYWYGHKYSKKTLFWLKNLPPLLPDVTNPFYKEFVRASRGKYRSRTFEGVARAIAAQWGDYACVVLNINVDSKNERTRLSENT